MATFCGINLAGGAVLSPMAGFTDDIFRLLCSEQGAIYTVSEMVSARAVALGDKKSHALCENRSHLSPYGIQLFGSRACDFAVASEKLMQYNPDFFDINCGCPAPKIFGSGSGSALLRTPEVIGEIVDAVKKASGLPVSVKLRTGIEGEPAAIAAAVVSEQAGASLVAVHGRCQKQAYRPPVDFVIAGQVKQALSIPVLFNGDISDEISYKNSLLTTLVDGVMIGRATLGNPFVFREINGGEKSSLTERVNMMLRHANMIFGRYGDGGVVAFRTHLTHYIKGFNGAAALRRRAVSVNNRDDVRSLAEIMINSTKA